MKKGDRKGTLYCKITVEFAYIWCIIGLYYIVSDYLAYGGVIFICQGYDETALRFASGENTRIRFRQGFCETIRLCISSGVTTLALRVEMHGVWWRHAKAAFPHSVMRMFAYIPLGAHDEANNA